MAEGVVISGASRGLGAALAQRYAVPGARLLLVARSAEALGAVAQSCRAQGAAVTEAVLDVRDAPGLAAALAAFEAAGPVGRVIANAGASAGTTPDGTLESAEAARRMVEVNLIGAMNLVAPLLPGMLARRAGRIGLVASVAGLRGLPDFPAYCASKAGLMAWGAGLRAAHAPRGLSVTVLAPGFFDSAMGDRFKGARPFKLSLEQAASRCHAAVEAGKRQAVFPWPMHVVMGGLALLPPGLGDWASRRMRFRVQPEA
jgi:short-subunit dehydrogenase